MPLLDRRKNISASLIDALRRIFFLMRIALLAGLFAPFPTVPSVWIAVELHTQYYMQKHNIIFRADLSEDYGLGFDVLIEVIAYGCVFYIIYFLLFFVVFMRFKKARSKDKWQSD